MSALFLTAMMSVLAAEPAGTDVYALVVGHNGGREGLLPLRFADDDALRMARTFSALPGHKQTWVLVEPDASTLSTLEAASLEVPLMREPTRVALFAARDELKTVLRERPAGRRATVYLFYAGHGLGGRLLLKPKAGAAEAGLSGEELKLLAASLPADDVVLFVDACRAQSLFTSRGASGPDLSARIAALDEKAAAVRLGVLAAAQSNQPAGETDRLQGGFFSHVLASGVLGGADADNDEVVRFGELAAFVAFHTERLTGQRPWFEPPGGDLQSATVQLHGATRLRLSEDTSGRLQISSISGVPYFAEVNKAKGRAIRLALPAGRYRVVRSSDGARATAEVELTAGHEQPLTADAFTAQPVVAERGGEDEGFNSPFTASVVAALDSGFVSGREPSVSAQTWRHALDVAYEISPAPFGLSGLEHGVEGGYRFALGNLVIGPKVAFRTSGFSNAQLRRLGVLLQAGWKWEPLGFLEVSPWGGVGFKAVWVDGPRGAAAPFAPGFGLGLRLSARVRAGFSCFVDGRYEMAWVALDGARQPYGEPAMVVGVSLWL
jgi:hypothetical protein